MVAILDFIWLAALYGVANIFGDISLLGHVISAMCKFELGMLNGFNFKAIFVEYHVGIIPCF